MSLVEMPNGDYVDVPDNISPDALNRIKSQNMPTRAQAVAQGNPRSSLTQHQQDVGKAADQYIADHPTGWSHPYNTIQQEVARPLGHGVFMGFDDELRGGLSAAANSLGNVVGLGNGKSFGDEYRDVRDTDREVSRRYSANAPLTSAASEIGGALVNPVEDGALAVQAAGKGAQAVGLTKAAGALGRTAGRMREAGAIPKALMAGGAQGALNAAGNADSLSDVPGSLVAGAGIGAATGGALGTLGHLGTRGIQILQDARPANAERTAFSRVGQMLKSGKTDAATVANEIADTNANGGDAMVQDMLPSLRAQAGAISRKPNVSGSNELIERGAQRIDERRARWGDQVRNAADGEPFNYATDADQTLGMKSGDAYERGDAINAKRRGDGQAGYAPGGVMDTPINPTPELQNYLKNAPDEVQSALKQAYGNMNLRDEPFAQAIGEGGQFTHIPNLRAFDYVKRSFDTQIGQALKSGDKETAQGLSYQLNKLKGVLADANPNDAEYKQLLAGQRDLFQKQNALEMGQGVLSRLSNQPRLVLRELQNLPDHAVQDARIGIVDALVNADNKADPVAYYRSLTRNDNQRKVMEFAFGGKGNLGRFERWVNREVRSTRADMLTAPGRQSETARFQMADQGDDGGVGNVLSNAMRGYAFGGSVGALSGVTRTLANIGTGTTRMTQEEIAKILLSKGENLVKGTEAAAAYQKARQAGNTRRAKMLGKAGQQLYTDLAGGR